MAKKPCARAGCPNVVDRGFCAEHASSSSAAMSERERLSAAKRGYGRKWQKYSAARLKSHPLCVDPDKRHDGRQVAATCTDHVIPHKGNMVLFWDRKNHQSLCDGCNAYKAAREEGGFGNTVRPGVVDRGGVKCLGTIAS
jgi:5-methylcytosine-specific restriction protein A